MNQERDRFSKRAVRGLERGGRVGMQAVWAGSDRWMSVVVVLLGAIFAAYACSAVALAQRDNTGKTVWDGVYTPEQAIRGKKLYETSCSECHLDTLQGDGADVPALADATFLDEWQDQPVDKLFTRIRETMPQDSPSSLTAQTYLDILAYTFQSNHFPPGTEELKRDADVLKAITIKKTK